MTGKKNGNNNNNNKSNKTRSSSPNNNQQQRPAKKQFIELPQPTEASSSKDISENVASSDMELDTTACPINDKGKASETSLSSPEAPIDINQAFDATENGLDNDKNKASGIHLERETEAPIYFAYCAAERFFPAKLIEKNRTRCVTYSHHIILLSLVHQYALTLMTPTKKLSELDLPRTMKPIMQSPSKVLVWIMTHFYP